MNLDNVYSFTVQRQNSSEVAPGKSPCVKIKFIKDESLNTHSPKYKIGFDNVSESVSVNEEEKLDIKVEDISSSSSPLSICPIYNRNNSNIESLILVLQELHKLIKKKDSHSIFAHPVTEEQAPNYSRIITNPIDLQTIKEKIDIGFYRSVSEMVSDLVLMCENAMLYNTPDTVYYKWATQMLNHIKRLCARDSVTRLVASRLRWLRELTNDEIGDQHDWQARIKSIQDALAVAASNSRTHRTLQMRRSTDYTGAVKRKAQCLPIPDSLTSQKTCRVDRAGDETSPSSSLGVLITINSDQDSSDVGDHGDDEDSASDDSQLDEVLATARLAARHARHRLQASRRLPVVYLTSNSNQDLPGAAPLISVQCIDPGSTSTSISVADQWVIDDELQAMATRIGSVNVEALIGDNDRLLAGLGQLCHDPNEVVSLTTSKPLEPYSCAEQAVLVETFGDVVTAEFACNMHNFVLDLPANSAAVAVVKNRLNTATNYLTYGVDQIITKKLRAAADAFKS